jgi:hypothetical protein
MPVEALLPAAAAAVTSTGGAVADPVPDGAVVEADGLPRGLPRVFVAAAPSTSTTSAATGVAAAFRRVTVAVAVVALDAAAFPSFFPASFFLSLESCLSNDLVADRRRRNCGTK